MSVKDKIGKMLYIDYFEAKAIKEIAGVYGCSESAIMRKALKNYIGLYEDLAKQGKEYKKKSQMTL